MDFALYGYSVQCKVSLKISKITPFHHVKMPPISEYPPQAIATPPSLIILDIDSVRRLSVCKKTLTHHKKMILTLTLKNSTKGYQTNEPFFGKIHVSNSFFFESWWPVYACRQFGRVGPLGVGTLVVCVLFAVSSFLIASVYCSYQSVREGVRHQPLSRLYPIFIDIFIRENITCGKQFFKNNLQRK